MIKNMDLPVKSEGLQDQFVLTWQKPTEKEDFQNTSFENLQIVTWKTVKHLYGLTLHLPAITSH